MIIVNQNNTGDDAVYLATPSQRKLTRKRKENGVGGFKLTIVSIHVAKVQSVRHLDHRGRSLSVTKQRSEGFISFVTDENLHG